MAVSFAQRKVIIVPQSEPLFISSSYISARRSVEDMHGLPAHAVLDDAVRPDNPRQQIRRNAASKDYKVAWAREALVYPGSGKKFKRGRDFIAPTRDDSGKLWGIPASSIPQEVMGQRGMALFVDLSTPGNLEMMGKLMVVEFHPADVVVLEGFPQSSGWGRMDDRTRVPLSVPKTELDDLPEIQKRYLYRIEGRGIRPLVRSTKRKAWQIVYAQYGVDNRFSYAYVEVQPEQGLQEALRR